MRKNFSMILTVSVLALVSGAVALAKSVSVDLKPYFNNDGISALESTGEPGLDKVSDGAWGSFDAAYFPAGCGNLTSDLSKDAVFTMPDPLKGLNNVECAGQEITVSAGKYSTLFVLATSHHGASEDAPVVLKYADGTTETAKFSFSDWCGAPKYDEVAVLDMDHRVDITTGASQTLNCFLSSVALKVDKTKSPVSISVPKETDDFVANHLHIFGLTLQAE